MTTILDVARDMERVTGKAPLTPRWEATLRAFYGLELREFDLDNLASGTRRTKEAWRVLARERGLNRRQYRELWARVGRRGRKSFTMALVAVFEAGFGGHERYLVQGEQGLIAVISKDIAGSTLVARFCELHAEALGIETNWSSIGSIRVLELVGIPFAIACFPCNAKAPRGFAIPVIIADEPAHWSTDDDSPNADDNVIGAIKPAMAQFPDSKLLAISSPFGKTGRHYATIEANVGDAEPIEPEIVAALDSDVLAVEGPTWEWNPDISEARTHEIEKNKKTHAREYAAECSDTTSAALDDDAIKAAQRLLGPGYQLAAPVVCLDFSSGRGDAVAWSLVRWAWTTPEPEFLTKQVGEFVPRIGTVYSPVLILDGDGNPIRNPAYTGAPAGVLLVQEIRMLAGAFWNSVSSPDLVARIARDCVAWGAGNVIADQHSSYALAGLFKTHGIGFTSLAWSNPNKVSAVERLKRWLRDRQIVLPIPKTGEASERLSRELHAFQEKLLPSGAITYAAPGSGHDDCVATIITAAIADAENLLPTSPTAPRIRRRDSDEQIARRLGFGDDD